jgi:hypothetical protein
MTELRDYPEDIARLIEERADAVPTKAAADRVRQRLDLSLGSVALHVETSAPASSTSSPNHVLRTALTLGVGAVLGGSIAAIVLSRPVIAPNDRGAQPLTASPQRVDSRDDGGQTQMDAGSSFDAGGSREGEAQPSSTALPEGRTDEPTAAQDEADGSERRLLERARVALGRGRFDDAILATSAHERRFPTGQFTEEREAIAIQALVHLGRIDEARARTLRFEARYPRSLFRGAIERALSAP